MKNNIKAVIFDMGGVLLRTVDPGPRDAMARRFGTTRKELEMLVFRGPTSVQSEVGEISDIAHWETVLKQFGREEEKPLDVYAEYFSGDAIDQGMLDFAKSLKPEYKIGLLSNAWVDSRNKLGSMFCFIETFDTALFSAEVKVRKPGKEIFLLMMDKMKVKPEECIFIDDFIENIEGAKKIGMRAILFKNAQETIQEVNAMLERG
jgi:glucose-1-phosphatase